MSDQEWVEESDRRTEERLERRNASRTSKGRRRDLLERPIGRRAAHPLLKELADFLGGRLEQKPDLPPRWLDSEIFRMTPETLAVMAIGPLLNAIDRGHVGDDGDPEGLAGRLKIKMGAEFELRLALQKQLRSESKAERRAARKIQKTGKNAWKLKRDWTPAQHVEVGHWLMMQCARVFNGIEIKDRMPVIVPECRLDMDALREELMHIDHVLMPHLSPPPDWTGWRIQYSDRLEETFVRSPRPQTPKAVTQAFSRGDFEHGEGVNHLRRVPLRMDPFMRDLIERVGPDVLDHKGEVREADERMIKADIRDARWIGDRPFWLGYNCDTRGRLCANQHLNFYRGDHVRSMIKFDQGMRLNDEGWYWLAVHAANCHGERTSVRGMSALTSLRRGAAGFKILQTTLSA